MDPFSAIVGVITLMEAAKKATDYLQAVKDGPKERVRLVQELDDLQSVLENYERLSARLRQTPDAAQSSTLRWLGDLEAKSSPLARSSKELEKLIARLEKPGKGPKGSKRRAATQAWNWPFSQQEATSSLERLGRMRQTLADGLNMDHLNLSLDTHEGVMVMSEHLADITQESLHDRIFRWLSAPDPFQSYEEARLKRLSRTGGWFIEHCEYRKWKKEPKSLLWLHGVTGFGKTVLSSTILEDLGEHSQGHIGHALAYFYFESNSTSDSTALLRSLLSQLSRSIKTGMPKLRELYHSCDKGRRQPSNDALSATLKSMLQSTPATYILLDALDECKNRSKLLDLIQTINDWQLENLHLLVTSRPEADITEVIAPLAGPEGTIELAPSPGNDDISNHIQTRLSLDRNLSRWRKRPDIQERIEKRLLDKGNGMFRWVDCQLDVLQDCVNLPMLEKALDSLPSTIGETYERMLLNIKDGFKESAIRAFQWLVVSREPLTIEQLVDILAIDIQNKPHFDPDWRMPDPDDILRVCSSLITIFPRGKDRCVKLAHASVKDYLVSDTILNGRASEYAIDYPRSHSDIAIVCLFYLSSIVKENVKPPTKDMEREQLDDTYPLAAYAATHWANHARLGSAVGEAFCPPMVALFQPDTFWIWFKIWTGIRYRRFFPHKANIEEDADRFRLPFAVAHSLSQLAQHLLKHGVDPNSQDLGGRPALQTAAMRKDLKIAEILLEHGADPNAPSRLGCRYALSWAARQVFDDFVNLLLCHGADINVIPSLTAEFDPPGAIQGDRVVDSRNIVPESPTITLGDMAHGSPLSDACSSEHLSTVQLLISRGADVNLGRDEDRETPLGIASSRGNLRIFRLLISHGAIIDRRHPKLHRAAAGGHYQIVRTLLESGANVEALDRWGQTALFPAVGCRRNSVVKLLLDSGAHVNVTAEKYGTPLRVATLTGDASLVRLLIEKGAKIAVDDRDKLIDEILLHDSSGHAKISMVECLLQAGGNQTENLRSCQKALPVACCVGDKDLVRFFTDYGVNVNGQEKTDPIPLHEAATYRAGPVVQLLLEAGAELHASGISRRDALHRALYEGQGAVARQLLAVGADPDVTTLWQIPLEEACSGKDKLTPVPEQIFPIGWLCAYDEEVLDLEFPDPGERCFFHLVDQHVCLFP